MWVKMNILCGIKASTQHTGVYEGRYGKLGERVRVRVDKSTGERMNE